MPSRPETVIPGQPGQLCVNKTDGLNKGTKNEVQGELLLPGGTQEAATYFPTGGAIETDITCEVDW